MSNDVQTTICQLATETPPQGWSCSLVGNIIDSVQPGFASGDHNKEGSGIPHLRPMNIDRIGRLDTSVLKFVPNSNPLRLEVGDVLFNNTNSPDASR